MAQRRRNPSYSRSGLPLVCGYPLPNGKACLTKTLGGCDEHDRPADRIRWVLDPHGLLCHYTAWFADRHPNIESPPAMGCFVAAWSRTQASGRPTMPPVVGPGDLREVYLAWQGRHGGDGVFPYDLALFVDHWEAKATDKEVE